MDTDRLHQAVPAGSVAAPVTSETPPTENSSIPLGGQYSYVPEAQTPVECEFLSKRKLTSLAPLDEPTGLRGGDVCQKEERKNLENEREMTFMLANDEGTRSETESVEKFRAFEEQMKALNLKLQTLANTVRQLGSSVGLVNATYHLRARLTQVQYYFQDNAARLSGTIQIVPGVGVTPYSTRRSDKIRKPTVAPEPAAWFPEIEELPKELDALAKDLGVFLNQLNDVSEITDEAVNASNAAVNTSITVFGNDLKYRVATLREFSGQMEDKAVARYINDLTADLGTHMDSVKAALDIFIDVGVPTIRFSQNRTATGLQNLSTVATFFSGVTATTLQFSLDDHNNAMENLVNALWLSSLVFSIASAINSQLAYHWHAATYRSPRSYVPWWVAIWITHTPLFLLVASVFAFLVGLCAFTYSSHQSQVVSAVVTFLTGITTLALLCVGLWFISERWTFVRTKGDRWLLDVLEDHSTALGKTTGFTPAKSAAKRGVRLTREVLRGVRRSVIGSARHVVDVVRRLWDNILNAPRDLTSDRKSSLFMADDGELHGEESPVIASGPSNGKGALEVIRSSTEELELLDRDTGSEEPTLEDRPLEIEVPSVGTSLPRVTESSNKEFANENNPGLISGAGPASSKNSRFKAVTKRVVNAFKLTATTHSSPPLRSMSSPPVLSERHCRDSNEHQLVPSRIQAYVPMLRTLRFNQLLSEHVALVKHLQFSPDGQFLATCSWDRTALIWRVGSGPSDGFQVMHKLVHTVRIGGFVGQVAWSPSGDFLLTKQLRSIKIWNPTNGVCQRTIDRGHSVQSVTWMPDGSGFVSVEWRTGSTSAEKRAHHLGNIVGSDLVIIGTDGKEKRNHSLDRLQVWDAAIVPGGERIVAVATLTKSDQGLKPIESRSEKRILIYNLVTEEIENQVPLLQEVRDITLTETGNYALVSYESKAPPQAWRIDRIAREQKCRLTLAHTYFTKHPVDFAGPSYFGGVNDTFVLAASKGGEIYIWERASGILLHSLKAPDQELTNIAWNHKSLSGFMFASAAHDGLVRIWTTTAAPLPPRNFAPSPEPTEAENSEQALLPRTESPPIASPGLMDLGST